MKNNKGITLVALVITIIILIILAGITISMVLGEDGLIGKAKNGANEYKNAAADEQTLLGKINELFDNNGSTGGNIPIYNSYEIGQEVKVGGEDFYVIEASDNTKNTVILLAKYNLNKAGTAQVPNAKDEDTQCTFSSTNYWKSAHAAYTNWSNEYLDINTISGEVEGDAIYKAKQYAIAKGATSGRLLKREEALELRDDYKNMIFGKHNEQGEGSNQYHLYYWLSSADSYNDRQMVIVVRL